MNHLKHIRGFLFTNVAHANEIKGEMSPQFIQPCQLLLYIYKKQIFMGYLSSVCYFVRTDESNYLLNCLADTVRKPFTALKL